MRADARGAGRQAEVVRHGRAQDEAHHKDGGVIVPYSIASNLTALSGTTQGSAAIQTMVYGDPMNYELGLFGDYTVRVDESVKAVERMLTILGDAMVGGNLIVDKGFVVATLPKTPTA